MGLVRDALLDVSVVSSLWAGGLGYAGFVHDASAADLARSLGPQVIAALDRPSVPHEPVMSTAAGSYRLDPAAEQGAVAYVRDRALGSAYDTLGALLAAIGLTTLVAAQVDAETMIEAREAAARDLEYFGLRPSARLRPASPSS